MRAGIAAGPHACEVLLNSTSQLRTCIHHDGGQGLKSHLGNFLESPPHGARGCRDDGRNPITGGSDGDFKGVHPVPTEAA